MKKTAWQIGGCGRALCEFGAGVERGGVCVYLYLPRPERKGHFK